MSPVSALLSPVFVLGAASSPELVSEFLSPYLPALFFDLGVMGLALWQWLGLAVASCLAVFLAMILATLGRWLALLGARRTRFAWDEPLVHAVFGPGRLLLGLSLFAICLRWLALPPSFGEELDKWLRVSSVATLTWAVLRLLDFAATQLAARFKQDATGAPIEARGAMTQTLVLKRVFGVVAVFLGAAFMLVQFEGMRTLGTSLLASAGVAGLVLGLAAQRSIGMLLAGIQISFTQPLRVGDVVIIEKEWGTIEEITLTYVVVKIWDWRRLIVPMTYILESPFQNWTRSSTNIMGTVFIHADYRVQVDEVRRELSEFVKQRPEWDGQVVGLVVTDATDKTVELRALVSSPTAGQSWDLRCAIREHLVTYLQKLDDGKALPRARVELSPTGA